MRAMRNATALFLAAALGLFVLVGCNPSDDVLLEIATVTDYSYLLLEDSDGTPYAQLLSIRDVSISES